MIDLLTKYRRDLHQIPELEFDLFETNKYLKKELSKLNFELIDIAKTGVLAIKKGKSDKSIAFRSDMDALPIEEANEISFKSKYKGRMHACGHDAHMAMLLTFANYISNLELNKTVVLIFQPAEEGPGGAKVIVDENIFEKYNIEKILGIHVFPGITEGVYGLANGPLTARNGEFNVEINSKSSHGAQPHLGVDSILVASNLINAYQSIVSRNIDPLEPCVVNVGKIHGGEARNILCGHVKLVGTIRAYNDEVYDYIKQRLNEISKGFEIAFNCNINTQVIDFYPAVINDEELFMIAKDTFSNHVIMKPLMIAEDFAFYLKKAKGFFLMLGIKNEEKGFTYPLHSERFNLDEKALIKGVEFYIEMAKKLEIF